MILYIVLFSRVMGGKQRAYNYIYNISRRMRANFIHRLFQLMLISKNGSAITCECVLLVNNVLKFLAFTVTSLNYVEYLPKSSDSNIYKVFLNTLYIDKMFVFINKPYGLSTQPGEGLNMSLVEILNRLYGPVYTVHRLDKHTTGCIFFVRLKSITKCINKLFFTGNLKKRYYAVVNNVFYGSFYFSYNYTIKGNIKDKLCISLHEVVVVHNYDNFTLLLITLVTGRKHQLRSGLSFFGHSIYGDFKYVNNVETSDKQYRLLLHSKDICIPVSNFILKEINVAAKLDYIFCYILFSML